jgi:hypothetical protein
MSTRCYFSNIRQRILHRAENAQKEIIIATPHFTSKEIFSTLLARTEAGTTTRIILQGDSINALLPWEQLIEKGGKVLVVKSDSFSQSGESLFIFDRKIAVAGNYTLTNLAEYGTLHSVVEFKEPSILKQYLGRTRQILELGVEFDRKLLVGNDQLSDKEDAITALENELEEELYRTLTMVKVNNLPLSADEIMHDIDTFGAVGTLRRHVMKDEDEVFQVLVEHGFVNRTFESMVAQDKYHHLFAGEVIKKAKARVS